MGGGPPDDCRPARAADQCSPIRGGVPSHARATADPAAAAFPPPRLPRAEPWHKSLSSHHGFSPVDDVSLSVSVLFVLLLSLDGVVEVGVVPFASGTSEIPSLNTCFTGAEPPF